ncbi:hypothetical protein AKJ62_04295 [candidate division MSBL1 archaeon SCGC-AAA259D14]|uniref:Cation:proton antiporter n=1 Tax=candidate division MSBL1 archaeon SCGC-AAA259D14 TaxID=1698261 RepID=A0A133U3T9_9EURY|nr:hypothetical protein AKJ62_04295 [candidate division MSBL1 archaeon SCGC-AAA259D14]
MTALHYPIATLLFVLGFYCLLFRRNLIKMVIGLELLTDGIHLFLISIGYNLKNVANPIPPILSGELLKLGLFQEFARRAVDPIPQVLVLTSIVIDVSIVALALSLIIYIYSKYETLNPYEIRELRG